MAKVTGQMAGQNGSVGQITYVTSGGETIARQKASNVKNPQTARQTAQRVIAKQVNMTYKKFKALCDHSFEGSCCISARFQQMVNKVNGQFGGDLGKHPPFLWAEFAKSPHFCVQRAVDDLNYNTNELFTKYCIVFSDFIL